MFILSDVVKADDVDEALNSVRAEIERLGGEVDSMTRLGKRVFARPLKKQEAGQYAVSNFSIEAAKLDALRKRFKLMEEVLRVQFVRAGGPVPVGEKSNG